MKVKKTILVLSLFWTLLLLCTVTYSWIARSWTPSIEYSKVSIATTGSLIISFENEDGSESIFNEVNLNDYLTIDEYVLKQVSSVDGKTFVSANFNPILDGKQPVYDDNVGKKYIETEFWVKTQFETEDELNEIRKEVFLHPDSYIAYTPLDESDESYNVDLTIRVSIELEGLYEDKAFILCKDRGTIDAAEDRKYDNETLCAAPLSSIGKEVFVNYPLDKNLADGTTEEQQAYCLDYFNGTSPERVLFTISGSQVQKVKVRIWLEGCDEYCVNEIAGKSLSLMLKFDSQDASQ